MMCRRIQGRLEAFSLLALGWCAWLFSPVGLHEVSGQEPVSPLAAQQKPYRINCALCHGAEGRGDGKAARFLFPKARDFSSGKMRIVSTVNRVANANDIRTSIERGFPGTSMQSWKHLGDESVQLLVAEVIRLRKQGVKERVVASWKQESPDVLADPAEVETIVKGLTSPGEVVAVPLFGKANPAAIARGQEIYVRQSCHSCHAKDGAGSWKMDLIDDKGRTSWATDLRFDPLKGPSDEAALARRILLGMPGSSMPSSGKLSDQDLVDLVRFCQSLSRSPKFELTNYQRARRAEGFRLPAEPTESP